MNKKLFLFKIITYTIGLTIYNFCYTYFINDILINNLNLVKQHFTNSTLQLPESN